MEVQRLPEILMLPQDWQPKLFSQSSLAANMTGGHIALLAILSFMAIFADMFHSTATGLSVALFSIPMATAISGLEIIVVMVQAYVFTL